jgi:hypothetical protein
MVSLEGHNFLIFIKSNLSLLSFLSAFYILRNLYYFNGMKIFPTFSSGSLTVSDGVLLCYPGQH